MSTRIRVLLADNNKELCHVLTEHIKQHEDLEVIGIAYDGLEAVEMVKKDGPDVLVLDISMPYLDGIGVMERLNELETRPRVIVLTAFEQESMVQRMINMGADYYIVKPFDTSILLDRIGNLAVMRVRPVTVRGYTGRLTVIPKRIRPRLTWRWK